MKKPIDRLKDARELISEGWTQGTMCKAVGRDDCYCIAGAMARVIKGNSAAGYEVMTRRYKDVRALHDSLPKSFVPDSSYAEDDDATNLISFNDHGSTTKQKVLRLFDRAIAKLKAEG